MNEDDLLICIKKIADSKNMSVNKYIEWTDKRNKLIKYISDCKIKKQFKSVYPENPDIIEKDGKVYVKNLKVMLAEHLIPKTGKEKDKIIKLPKTLSEYPNPPIGWWASEKWDGIRAIWDGEKFISRGSAIGIGPKVYSYVPQWFIDCMPPGVALDGEIWLGRNMFQLVSKLSNIKPGGKYSKQDIDDIWAGKYNKDILYKNAGPVKYMIFDCIRTEDSSIINQKTPYENRMSFATQVIDGIRKCCKLKYFPLIISPTKKINSMEECFSFYHEVTGQGAEGLILRAPDSPYLEKRSKLLLKMKLNEDSECIAIEVIEGTGKNKGICKGSEKAPGGPYPILGSLRCQIIKDNILTDKFTNVGSGFTDVQRQQWWNPNSSHYLPMGTTVSFSYMEETDSGIPRHPIFRGVREDLPKPVSKKILKDVIEDRTRFDYNSKKGTFNINFEIVHELEEMRRKVHATEEPRLANIKDREYKIAIDCIQNSPEPIKNVKIALMLLRACGKEYKNAEKNYEKTGKWKEKILAKINEIIETGSLSAAEQSRNDPRIQGITELSTIPQIGPIRASKLYDSGFTNIKKLREGVEQNVVKLTDGQILGLKYYNDLKERIPKDEMDKWNKLLLGVLNSLSPNTTGIIVGSYRRGLPTSGDIDFIMTNTDNDSKIKNKLIKELTAMGIIKGKFSSGKVKFMGVAKLPGGNKIRHLDVAFYEPEIFPFALLHWTGSGQFNIKLRLWANNKGLSLSEYGIRWGSSQGPMLTQKEFNEKDIFKLLELKYIPPENRNINSKSKFIAV